MFMHIFNVYGYLVTDFTELSTHYQTILHLMPDDYEATVGKLQNYINIDQICAILNSSNPTIAKKLILDCLIQRISCKEELLDLCDQLESIITSHELKDITDELRLRTLVFTALSLSTCSLQPIGDISNNYINTVTV